MFDPSDTWLDLPVVLGEETSKQQCKPFLNPRIADITPPYDSFQHTKPQVPIKSYGLLQARCVYPMLGKRNHMPRGKAWRTVASRPRIAKVGGIDKARLSGLAS